MMIDSPRCRSAQNRLAAARQKNFRDSGEPRRESFRGARRPARKTSAVQGDQQKAPHSNAPRPLAADAFKGHICDRGAPPHRSVRLGVRRCARRGAEASPPRPRTLRARDRVRLHQPVASPRCQIIMLSPVPRVSMMIACRAAGRHGAGAGALVPAAPARQALAAS